MKLAMNEMDWKTLDSAKNFRLIGMRSAINSELNRYHG